MRTDTPALLESLEAISTLFSDHSTGSSSGAAATTADGEKAGGAGHEYNTLDARRSLREDLERQVRLSNPTLNSADSEASGTLELVGTLQSTCNSCSSRASMGIWGLRAASAI